MALGPSLPVPPVTRRNDPPTVRAIPPDSMGRLANVPIGAAG